MTVKDVLESEEVKDVLQDFVKYLYSMVIKYMRWITDFLIAK